MFYILKRGFLGGSKTSGTNHHQKHESLPLLLIPFDEFQYVNMDWKSIIVADDEFMQWKRTTLNIALVSLTDWSYTTLYIFTLDAISYQVNMYNVKMPNLTIVCKKNEI